MSYVQLPAVDPDSGGDNEVCAQSTASKQGRAKSNRAFLLKRSILLLFISTLTLLLTFAYFQQLSPASREDFYLCGDGPAEALSKGCLFDMMSFSWLPPACFDNELMDHFLTRQNWTWYNVEGEHELSLPLATAEVRDGGHDAAFVSWEYHFFHCTYMWRKLHRAVLQGRPVDGYIGNMHHTVHCADILLHQDEMVGTAKTTMIFVKYPSCGESVEALADKDHRGWYRMEGRRRVFGTPPSEQDIHPHR